MNRNTNAHFANLPNVDVQRSIMDRSHSHKTSGNVGQIIPVYVDADIMPGDTVSIDTSKVVRFQTLLTPMMDNIQCDVYWFFCPNRLIWDHWINFMGENTDSAWTPQVEYTVPKIRVPTPSTTGSLSKSGTILDYMGFPVGINTQPILINALPIRSYARVMNDWFRSENLTDPINLYTGDATKDAIETGNYINDVAVGGAPFIAAKYHDYFTSCLPSPQKGDAVEIKVDGISLPVISTSGNAYEASLTNAYSWTTNSGGAINKNLVMHGVGLTGNNQYTDFAKNKTSDTTMNSVGWTTFDSALNNTATTFAMLQPANLWTAAPQGLSFTVNDMRYAFALQKLLERDARSGTRYIEVIRSHFGVISPDARMQRSEYLGGNRFSINVDQVSNTAQTENDFLGDLGAYSVTSDIHSDFTHSFTEHGVLLGLMVVRYDHTYAQGLHRMWTRNSRFDYFWPVFQNIGEQPVRKYEIFCDGENDDQPFGYNEAWSEYRYAPNRVSGEMRPYVPNGLFSWTLADDYDTTPSLSDSWLREDKTNVDRVLAVTSTNANQFWCDFYFNAKYTRPMPIYSIPGLIDHN